MNYVIFYRYTLCHGVLYLYRYFMECCDINTKQNKTTHIKQKKTKNNKAT